MTNIGVVLKDQPKPEPRSFHCFAEHPQMHRWKLPVAKALYGTTRRISATRDSVQQRNYRAPRMSLPLVNLTWLPLSSTPSNVMSISPPARPPMSRQSEWLHAWPFAWM